MTRARAKRWARALGVLALFVLAFWLTGCDPAVFWARRAHLRDIAAQLFPPDWSYLSAIVAPLLATLRMSVTGTALGVALALGFAPLCAHNLPCPAPVRAVLRFLVQVLRSFPALILALLATFLFGLGTFSGTVAITAFTLAVMTRLTYEDIETLTLAPYATRDTAQMDVTVKTKLAAAAPAETTVYLAYSDDGLVTASEKVDQIPGQIDMDGREAPTPNIVTFETKKP